MLVCSFDPGIVTGYCWCDTNTDRYAHEQIVSKDLREVIQRIVDTKPDIVLYEDFKHRGGMISAEMYSLQVIGAINYYCQTFHIKTWHCLPAEAKAFWNDKKLRAIGIYKPVWKHANDASRVCLTWRMKNDFEWWRSVVPMLKEMDQKSQRIRSESQS